MFDLEKLNGEENYVNEVYMIDSEENAGSDEGCHCRAEVAFTPEGAFCVDDTCLATLDYIDLM